MSEINRLNTRNAAISAMLLDSENIKNFYRFIAQNPHINLHDACQIVCCRTPRISKERSRIGTGTTCAAYGK